MLPGRGPAASANAIVQPMAIAGDAKNYFLMKTAEKKELGVHGKHII